MDDQCGREKQPLLLPQTLLQKQHLLRWKSKVSLNFYVIVYSPLTIKIFYSSLADLPTTRNRIVAVADNPLADELSSPNRFALEVLGIAPSANLRSSPTIIREQHGVFALKVLGILQ